MDWLSAIYLAFAYYFFITSISDFFMMLYRRCMYAARMQWASDRGHRCVVLHAPCMRGYICPSSFAGVCVRFHHGLSTTTTATNPPCTGPAKTSVSLYLSSVLVVFLAFIAFFVVSNAASSLAIALPLRLIP